MLEAHSSSEASLSGSTCISAGRYWVAMKSARAPESGRAVCDRGVHIGLMSFDTTSHPAESL